MRTKGATTVVPALLFRGKKLYLLSLFYVSLAGFFNSTGISGLENRLKAEKYAQLFPFFRILSKRNRFSFKEPGFGAGVHRWRIHIDPGQAKRRIYRSNLVKEDNRTSIESAYGEDLWSEYGASDEEEEGEGADQR
ncbi:hypothetical protein R1flu_028694 [Riccia fluitans]|uniref:Uncharacterized protein n=1 Tax=Riccia fluitans TaxID=41844 RepID=A0ABD1XQF0_9MARC